MNQRKVNLPLISRRRSLVLMAASLSSAAALSCPSLGMALSSSQNSSVTKKNVQPLLKEIKWQGVVLGADATIILYAEDAAKAKKLIIKMLAEVKRLEGYFSLFQAGSLISELNKMGEINNPPAEFFDLLSQSMDFAARSNGAFDPTIQPLFLAYKLLAKQKYKGPYADHLSVKDAQSLINWKNLRIRKNEIRFMVPAMGLSLNGIAQGYITDRAVDILKNSGYETTLINFGEYHGTGKKPDDVIDPEDNSWKIQLGTGERDVYKNRPVWRLQNNAIAASDRTGFVFDPDKNLHHMLDPKTGRNQKSWDEIYVMAENATKADAASTALFATAPGDIKETFHKLKLEKALFIKNDGKQVLFSK